MTGGKRQGKEASYNGALSAARRDKKAWGRGVAMSIRDNFLIFAIFDTLPLLEDHTTNADSGAEDI